MRRVDWPNGPFLYVKEQTSTHPDTHTMGHIMRCGLLTACHSGFTSESSMVSRVMDPDKATVGACSDILAKSLGTSTVTKEN